MSKVGDFLRHLKAGWLNLWAHIPQAEHVVTEVIAGIGKATGLLNSGEADLLASLFPNGIGTKDLNEIRALSTEALQVTRIGQDALKSAESIADPTQKANAVITHVLTEIAKLPDLAREAHTLNVIAAFVSKVLGISLTDALHMVTTKQLELAAA